MEWHLVTGLFPSFFVCGTCDKHLDRGSGDAKMFVATSAGISKEDVEMLVYRGPSSHKKIQCGHCRTAAAAEEEAIAVQLRSTRTGQCVCCLPEVLGWFALGILLLAWLLYTMPNH